MRGGRPGSRTSIEDAEAAVAVVRDAPELRRAVGGKDGAPVVELSGVEFILAGKPLRIGRSLRLVGQGVARLVAQGGGFVAVEVSGGCKVEMQQVLIESGGGRSQGAAIKVSRGATLAAQRCTVRGSVAVTGEGSSLQLSFCQVLDSPFAGVTVEAGAEALVADSTIERSSGDGLYASGPKTVAQLERSKISAAGWNGVWSCHGALARMQGGVSDGAGSLGECEVADSGRRAFVVANGGEIEGLTDEQMDPENGVLHTLHVGS